MRGTTPTPWTPTVPEVPGVAGSAAVLAGPGLWFKLAAWLFSAPAPMRNDWCMALRTQRRGDEGRSSSAPLGVRGRGDPCIQGIGPTNIGRDAVLSPSGESATCPTDIPASDVSFFKFKTGAK